MLGFLKRIFKRKSAVDKELSKLPKKIKTKLILIGLDAATLRFIEPLVKEGKLPTLKKIQDRGVYGTLESIAPTISPSVWTTIFTGKTRKNHNIYGFYNNKSELGARRIWEILHHHNIPIGTVGAFLTSPPELKYKFMIPNMWVMKDDKTYPEEFHFVQNWFDYEPDKFKDFKRYGLTEKTIKYLTRSKKRIKNLARQAKRPQVQLGNLYLKTDVFIYLLRKTQPDFGLIAYYGADAFQHIYMHHYKPEWFEMDPSETNKMYENLIPKYYMDFDKQLSKIMAVNSSETNYIIVSDHGAQPAPKKLRKIYRVSELKLIELLKLEEIAKPTFAHGYITLELPSESIEPIAALLDSLTVEENGLKFISMIRKFKDHLEVQNNMKVVKNPEMHNLHINHKGNRVVIKDLLIENELFGLHSQYGYWNGYGPAFKQQAKQVNLSILDITPLILIIFGLPIGKDMPGKFPEEILNEKFKTFTYSEKPYEDIVPSEIEQDDRDLENIKRQLEGLGYLG